MAKTSQESESHSFPWQDSSSSTSLQLVSRLCPFYSYIFQEDSSPVTWIPQVSLTLLRVHQLRHTLKCTRLIDLGTSPHVWYLNISCLSPWTWEYLHSELDEIADHNWTISQHDQLFNPVSTGGAILPSDTLQTTTVCHNRPANSCKAISSRSCVKPILVHKAVTDCYSIPIYSNDQNTILINTLTPET